MDQTTLTYNIEVTDTFGGEANYGWVRREKLKVDESVSDRALVRRAKKRIGWSGMPCRVAHYGDSIELRPHGLCQICFISLQY